MINAIRRLIWRAQAIRGAQTMINSGVTAAQKNTLKVLLNGADISALFYENNQLINPQKMYHVATIDYLANGGDKCEFFVGNKQILTGILFRDAIIEYINECSEKGQSIQAKLQGRIQNLR